MPVSEIAEQLAKRAKSLSKADAAGRQAAVAASDTAFTANVNATAQQMLEEFKVTQGAIDAEVEAVRKARIVSPEEANKKVLQAELDRTENLFDPLANVRRDHQTQGPEEFSRRLRQQLYDSNYSSRALEAGPLVNKEVDSSLIKDSVFQSTVGFGLRTNPRVKARAAEWTGDSPYEDRIFVHVDRQSDPIRGQEDFIQFDQPREMGLHSGTNRAAIQATLKSEEAALQQTNDLDEIIDEIAGFSDNPTEFKTLFGKAVNDHFTNKFLDIKSGGVGVFDEVEAVMRSIFKDMEAPPELINKYIAKAKQLPTASSTPHLFRGRNGLYLKDEGGFGTQTVGRQLLDIFPEDADVIETALAASGNVNKQKALQTFIEDKGYDHIIYHNSVEDKGTTSIINWNPDLMLSTYDPRLVGDAPNSQVGAQVAMVMASLGLGVAARDE